jgi:methionine biosynthesis protein MetW
MLRSSQERVLEQLSDDALVLDVGGWASPFARADWVIDLMPYETRSPYEWSDRSPDHRFSKETWVQRDICDKEPYPFEDDRFDFVVCAQTLEDVRDPVWVCSEMIRVGRAGYIEVPSRLVEQTYGMHGPWVGYSHHRWLIDVDGNDITFVFKTHEVNRDGSHFPRHFVDALAPEEHEAILWWEHEFGFSERIFFEKAELDSYLEDFVASELSKRETPTTASSWSDRARRLVSRGRSALG